MLAQYGLCPQNPLSMEDLVFMIYHRFEDLENKKHGGHSGAEAPVFLFFAPFNVRR